MSNNRWDFPHGQDNQSQVHNEGPVQYANQNYVAKYVSGVFGWMFLALAVTAVSAFVSVQFNVLPMIFERFGGFSFIAIILIQFGLVGFMAVRFQKMNFSTLLGSFLAYSVIQGLVFALLFMVYQPQSIITCFGITSLTFGIMSVVGYTTKTDLTKFGRLMMMGLVGIVVASLVNMFMGNEMLYYIISYVGVAVFVGLIAYDVQKIKSYAFIDDADMKKKASVMGAFSLYLDFINLFIFILRIFGDRR